MMSLTFAFGVEPCRTESFVPITVNPHALDIDMRVTFLKGAGKYVASLLVAEVFGD